MSWVTFLQILVLMVVAYVLIYVSMHAYLEKKVKLDIEKHCTIQGMPK